jgi:hypothetical protein
MRIGNSFSVLTQSKTEKNACLTTSEIENLVVAKSTNYYLTRASLEGTFSSIKFIFYKRYKKFIAILVQPKGVNMIMVFFILFCVVIILAINYNYYQSRYARFPTFEEYKSQNPDLIKPGRVACFQCGGTKLHVRGLWNAMDNRKTHFCSTCGAPLYRSKH